VRHARGDRGTLLAFASRSPPLAATWRARYGSRHGFARRVPLTPRRPPVVGAAAPTPEIGAVARSLIWQHVLPVIPDIRATGGALSHLSEAGLKQSPQPFVKRSQVELVSFLQFRRKLIGPCFKDAKQAHRQNCVPGNGPEGDGAAR
jgi:hypothetical protein